jgi:hypothetical protein
MKNKNGTFMFVIYLIIVAAMFIVDAYRPLEAKKQVEVRIVVRNSQTFTLNQIPEALTPGGWGSDYGQYWIKFEHEGKTYHVPRESISYIEIKK